MTTIYPVILGREAMVSTEHYLSASAGARIFARGGNAIDAAVAATLVEGVVNPHMHTIGGEAPMLIYVANSARVVAVNGNMIAPARATIAHYRDLIFVPIFGASPCAVSNSHPQMALSDTRIRDFAICRGGLLVTFPRITKCSEARCLR